MSNYSYVCPCCKKSWSVNSTGPKPKKAELARMCCKPCRDGSAGYREGSQV